MVITRLLLHAFAKNLARLLSLGSYIHICQNIKQNKSKHGGRRHLGFLHKQQ